MPSRAWVSAGGHDRGRWSWARNLTDGRVAVTAEGERRALERLLELLEGDGTPGRVDEVATRWGEPTGAFRGFVEL